MQRGVLHATFLSPAMQRSSGSAGRPAEHCEDSSAARSAQHPIIIRQCPASMSGDAFAECVSTDAAEAFFQQCPATELTGREVDLLNSLICASELSQAVLPRSVTLQEWAHRRVPRGFERQVNSSGIVYVGDRFLQYVPLLRSQPRSASSAAQPASDSTAAQPASVLEEVGLLDFYGRYDLHREAFFQECLTTELTGPEVDLLNSLIRVSESLLAVLPRSVTLQEWAHRRVPPGLERRVNSAGIVPLLLSQPRSASSAAQPASDSIAAQPVSVVEESVLVDDGRYDGFSGSRRSMIEEDDASSYSNTTGDSAGPRCFNCGDSITTRPWEVWWTTLLVAESQMPHRPMCSLDCLVEYCTAIYCPHPAMDTRFQERVWRKLSKARKPSINTTRDSSGNSMDSDSATSYRQSNSVSNAEQPAFDSAGTQLVSVIPRELILPMVRFVGAHNLETIWTCSECKPYWYNWYCDECKTANRFLHWSPRLHYGHCGQSCDCCRSANREVFPCEFCDDLWNLKGTCHTMWDLVKTYDAT